MFPGEMVQVCRGTALWVTPGASMDRCTCKMKQVMLWTEVTGELSRFRCFPIKYDWQQYFWKENRTIDGDPMEVSFRNGAILWLQVMDRGSQIYTDRSGID